MFLLWLQWIIHDLSCWQTHWRDSPCWPDEISNQSHWESHMPRNGWRTGSPPGTEGSLFPCSRKPGSSVLSLQGNASCQQSSSIWKCHPQSSFQMKPPLSVCNQGRLWGKKPTKGLPTDRKCEIIGGCYFQFVVIFFNAIIASSYFLFI